jgi:hypothetical protein
MAAVTNPWAGKPDHLPHPRRSAQRVDPDDV